ncbi:MAG: hypothetical protein U5J82_08105 [Desulfobacterales bacterium]|nr:hypothetical protein [Desulfobacterales bacterium]
MLVLHGGEFEQKGAFLGQGRRFGGFAIEFGPVALQLFGHLEDLVGVKVVHTTPSFTWLRRTALRAASNAAGTGD